MPYKRNEEGQDFDQMSKEAQTVSKEETLIDPQPATEEMDDLPPADADISSPVEPDLSSPEDAAPEEMKEKINTFEERPLTDKDKEFLQKFPWENIRNHTGLTYEKMMRSYDSKSANKQWTANKIRRFMNGNYVDAILVNPMGEPRNAYISVSIRKGADEKYILKGLDIVDIPFVVPKLDKNGDPIMLVTASGEQRPVMVPGKVELPEGSILIHEGRPLSQEMSESLVLTGSSGTPYIKTEYTVLTKGKDEGRFWWAPVSEFEYNRRLNAGAKAIASSEGEYPSPSEHELGTIRKHTTEQCLGLCCGRVIARNVAKIDSYFDSVIVSTEKNHGFRAYRFVDYASGESFLIDKSKAQKLARGKVVTLVNQNGASVSVRYDVFYGKVIPAKTFDQAKRESVNRSQSNAVERSAPQAQTVKPSVTPSGRR